MKNTAIVMTAVLMMGLVLSMGFSSAISANANVIAKAKTGQTSVSLNDIENEAGLEAEFDIKKANRDIDSSVERDARESTFAQVSIGQGWAISSGNNTTNTTSEGSFVRIFWVEKNFVNEGTNASNQTSQTSANETTKLMGTLKMERDLYKLTLDSQTDDSIIFDVSSEKGNVDGTLKLRAGTSLLGFTVWSGTLDLDSGKSYNINVATKNSKVKGSVDEGGAIRETNSGEDENRSGLQGNLNAETRGEGKKLGLFSRIRAFFRGE